MRPLVTFVRRLFIVLVAVALVALVVGGVWIATHRDEATALRQTATVGVHLGEVPGVVRVVGWIDDDIEASTLSEPGGLPASVVVPAGGGEHPAVVMLVPNNTSDAELASVEDVQRALAHAGIAAWALRTPDAGKALGEAQSLPVLVDALDAIRRDRRTANDRVSIAGVGALGSLALVASADPKLAGHVRAILAVQPVADVQGLIRLAVTGTVRGADGVDRPHPSARQLRETAGEAIIDAARTTTAGGQSAVADGVLTAAAASDDPFASLQAVPSFLLPESLRDVAAVLGARTPAAFDTSWARLPAPLREHALERSPLARAEEISSRVLLAVPRDDRAYPDADAERLAAVMDNTRLRRSRLLDPGADIPGDATADALRDAIVDTAWWMERAGS